MNEWCVDSDTDDEGLSEHEDWSDLVGDSDTDDEAPSDEEWCRNAPAHLVPSDDELRAVMSQIPPDTSPMGLASSRATLVGRNIGRFCLGARRRVAAHSTPRKVCGSSHGGVAEGCVRAMGPDTAGAPSHLRSSCASYLLVCCMLMVCCMVCCIPYGMLYAAWYATYRVICCMLHGMMHAMLCRR